ncbi:MAG: hypothetical protein LIO93_00800 [Bacteroidales bacterium]|nr:hypothetical protein [Bacteroidales bacterium]
MSAQLPEISTSASPKWYYIQVTGSDDRQGRVFTAEDDVVSGRNLDSLLLDQQLWRFELSGNNYTIINKGNDKKLDIVYDPVRNINHAVLSDSPSTLWKLEVMTTNAGYNITATTPPSEKSTAMYAHQSNAPSNRNYVIMFETTTWKNALNSTFNFIEFSNPDDNPDPQPRENKKDSLWYYIQVKGQTDRANLVYTQEGDLVFGRAVMDDLNEVDRQLWRFQQTGESYVLFNKATGKKLDMIYDTTLKINVAVLRDTASTNWVISQSPTANYFNIKAETALEGRTSYIYSHQANNYGGRNYAVMFEIAAYRYDNNSLYSFIPYESPLPVVSTSDNEVWYTIETKKTGFESKCITDVTDQSWMNIRFALNDITAGDYTQQWKIVDINGTDVQFVNRATGNIMQTEAVYNRYYYTQPAPYSTDAKGWTISYIGQGQCEISGYTQEGVEVHMNAASDQQDADTYLPENNQYSGFAWAFNKVVETDALQVVSSDFTSLDEISISVRIWVENRTIRVEGVEEFTVRNISGVEVNPAMELPVGVYLVSFNGKTTKILIK